MCYTFMTEPSYVMHLSVSAALNAGDCLDVFQCMWKTGLVHDWNLLGGTPEFSASVFFGPLVELVLFGSRFKQQTVTSLKRDFHIN